MSSLQSAINRVPVRAPEFPAGTWFNTAAPLSLAGLRGKIVLLDFWTFCCGNCLHVIDELRPLELDFADELVIIGVHSPKFEHERADTAVRDATDRYEVGHPVFNDPELYLWRQYAVRAWPTLVLIDPNGYVVAQAAGEGQVSGLRAIIGELITRHEADGSLRRGDSPYVRPPVEAGDLRFPARAITLGDSLWIVDSGHHQLVETALDATTVRRRIGSGQRGAGPTEFNEPNGVAALPSELAADLGFDLVVADTGNHVLRGVDSRTAAIVRTIDLPAGLQGTSTITGTVPGVLSPWDVAFWPAAGTVAVAAAGVHLLLGWDPVTDRVTILAGTTVEGLRDGPALDGWLAQPSGLAVDGNLLWFVDSETSALRYLTITGELHTAVGEGLFDFGHVDGPAAGARLQHPLGVAVLADGSIAIADTYNGALRRYDPTSDTVSTLATDLAEPSGVLVVPDPAETAAEPDAVADADADAEAEADADADGPAAGIAAADIVVVESAAHRLVRPVPAGQLSDVHGQPLTTQRPVLQVAAGQVSLSVRFTPPPGRKLDDRFGPSSRLLVSASPPGLIVSGAGDGSGLDRRLVISGEAGQRGVLSVTAQAASCDDDPATEHPACYLARQDWGIPVLIGSGGTAVIELPLLG